MCDDEIKSRFFKWIATTHDPAIVWRVKEILKESSPTEEKLWAALNTARAAYERELRGPMKASLMRFSSRIRR